MKVEVIEVETEHGIKRISMRSTGMGAWVSVSNLNPNPLRIIQIRPVVWIKNASEIGSLIAGSN